MLLRPLGLERKQSGQSIRCTKVCFRWNQAGTSVLSGTTGPFFAPAAGTLEALPRGALFLCLAELFGEPASGSAHKAFASISVDRVGAVKASSTDALLGLRPAARGNLPNTLKCTLIRFHNGPYAKVAHLFPHACDLAPPMREARGPYPAPNPAQPGGKSLWRSRACSCVGGGHVDQFPKALLPWRQHH
jgi:hypothetical protein